MSEEKKVFVPNVGQWWGVRMQIDGLDGARNVRRLIPAEYRSRGLFGCVDESDVLIYLLGEGDIDLRGRSERAVYLGDGEQPEPTPWMIEQLAGLLWKMSGTCVPWAQSGCAEYYRKSVVQMLSSPKGFKDDRVRAVRHMHAVLRSLGYA